jgi:tetratricopeptide (TPR) repeat protein
VRQVGLVDREGKSAAHTGSGTQAWSGHRTAEGVSVQGNILVSAAVVDSMLHAFQTASGPLAERLLLALEAGEQAGGDRRGKQSAALQVVRRHGGYQGVDDRLVDLKVVDQAEPVAELRRLYDQWQYAFLVEAYVRLAEAEPGCEAVLMRSVRLLLDRALNSTLTRAEVFNELAWHLALRRKYPEETLRAAQRAQELAPDDPDILDTLAEAWFAAGDPGTAASWEERALRLAPNSEFFQRQLRRFTAADGTA